jgi:flagellar basal-body rod protein FlgC
MAVASLRLEVSAGNIANTSSGGASDGTPGSYVQKQVIQIAVTNGGTSATVTSLPAAYSPSYDAQGNAGGTSVNVNLAYELVQQIMARFGFAANAQVVKSDARAMAAFLDIIA